jgi:ABC-type polysaccharide/polyol phosphate transport system ATPase subunit
MAKPVIEFDHISKSFEIGKLGSETLRQDLIKYWKQLTQKASLDSSNHTFWALQDIFFGK